MRRGLLALAGLALSVPAPAAPLSTDATGCGGNAYSSAQIVDGRTRQRGPLTAMPDTLCADLDAPRGQTRIEIYGVPGPNTGGYDADGDRGYGLGAGGDGAPYEPRPRGRPRRGD